MVLAQVPLARFLNVPKRNSYAEWMRRLGSQCVDFVVCDTTLAACIAVVDVRVPEAQMSDRAAPPPWRASARALKAAGIPLHVWLEDALPSVDAARATLLPHGRAPRPCRSRR